MIDYRNLRLNNIKTEEFKHLFLLLYWPLYGFLFWLVERGLSLNYKAIECQLDAKIPFCEFFVFPYYFWFVFMVGIYIYTLFFDIPAFKKMMYFTIITYTLTIIVYLLYPNKQELRPTEFERNNFCVSIVKYLYNFDTNTNVCPSIHVIGSFSVLFTTFECKKFRTPLWIVINTLLTVLISISTVFLKQHSVIDIFVALIVCGVAYPVAYILPNYIKKGNTEKIKQTEKI